MLNQDTQAVVDILLPLLRQYIDSPYGIAVGGAHAKGTADCKSDLDFYIFANSPIPNEDRTRQSSSFHPDISKVFSWGAGSPFVQGGTDFTFDQLKVECWIRSSDYVADIIAGCENGVLKRELVTWTPTGFYNHCALSDLNALIPIDDPDGMLADWKDRIKVYPPKLRRQIMHRHLNAARFWPSNFHYLSAVQRQDIIYTTAITQQVVHNLIQVLFAFNKVYFPGDKKLGQAIRKLETTPQRFAERIEELIAPGIPLTVDTLTSQQTQLLSLFDDVKMLVQDELDALNKAIDNA